MRSMGEHFKQSMVGESADLICRKQARRTGMAGPLGEMFDHGKKQPMLLYGSYANGGCY